MRAPSHSFIRTRSYEFGRVLKRFRWPLAGLLATGVIVVLGPWTYAVIATHDDRYDSTKVSAADVPSRRVAIVFGARVNGDEPTPFLWYRVDAAVKLYKAGRVQKLLMTGDNSLKNYDEPAVMRQTAIDEGVKAADITVDDAGFSTYDSCYRAKHVFQIESAILVSQNYHLPRAILACDCIGVSSIGYGAYADHPALVAQYTVREWLSTDKIVVQLASGATSKFVGPAEPIK